MSSSNCKANFAQQVVSLNDRQNNLKNACHQHDDETLHFELDNAHHKVVELVGALEGLIRSISISEPTLEDVFLRRTGRGFWDDREGDR